MFLGRGGLRSMILIRGIFALGSWAMLATLVVRADERDIASAAPNSVAPTATVGIAKKSSEPLTQPAIERLIARLGDEQFSVRERAQRELESQGSAIYERLLPALRNRDPEIATRAARITATIRERACDELSVPGKRDELKNYFSENFESRRNTLAHFTLGSSDSQFPLLCRIVRFEPDEQLSKSAALRLLESTTTDAAIFAERGRQIRAVLATTDRPSAVWLREYADQSQVNSVEYLTKLIAWSEVESRLYEEHASPDQLDVAVRMLKAALAYSSEAKRREESIVLFGRLIDLERPAADELPALLTWIVKQNAWELLPALQSRFPALAESSDPRVLYLLAESATKQGNAAESETYVVRALESQKENAGLHLQTALILYSRGMHDWCERECRVVIAVPKQGEGIYGFRALSLLSEICNDQERFEDAANLLDKASTLLRKNESIQEQARGSLLFGDDRIRVKLHYNRGMQHAKNGDVASAYREFKKALDQDATDADVLIGLYRLPDLSEAQRKETLRRIAQGIEHFQNEIQSDPDDPQTYNQYAWLVANTAGDFDLALEHSKKSLEVYARISAENRREATETGGLLDTLAHCYFAKKDFDNAVKTQTRAVELEPQSKTIKRNLVRFQKAKAAADAEKAASE